MPGSATRLPETDSASGRLGSAVRAAGGIRAVELANGERVPLAGATARLIAAVLEDEAKVSPEEAARLLGVSRPMVVRWIDDGLLADEPVGAHHRIPLSSVVALREERRAAGRSALRVKVEAEKGDEAALARVRAAHKRAQARIARR